MGLRVLITTPSLLGHVHPMLPLARALTGRGHDVLWAIPPDGVSAVERAGFRTAVAGRPGLENLAEARRRYPELAGLPKHEVPDALFGKTFGAVAGPPALADLMPIAQRFRPQLVVCDAAEFAAHIVAAELGVPSVTKGFGPLLPERRVARASEEVAPLWRSRGLEPRPYGGSYDHLYLDVYPPELRAGSDAHVGRRQPLRPVVEDHVPDDASPATLPLPAGPPDAPLVYVTMGTVFNDPKPLLVVLEALRDFDGRVLVTVGPEADPAVVGIQPAHVRVERYVPQSLVLPLCAVVVSHAGSGTVLGSLTLGLPQLCLPQGADQFLNAAAIASSGAGISIMPADATPGSVRDAVDRLVGDATFRDTAHRLSTSIGAMPSPDDVVCVLETLPE
jgi:UDP:flavonoid glycosyltransferase YjiC (YdhE family)